MEKSKLHTEKIELENHLEAEQEFIMNKLQKQVCGRLFMPIGPIALVYSPPHTHGWES